VSGSAVGDRTQFGQLRRRELITLLGSGLLAGGALLATATFAQGTGRWTVGTPMPSSRTEVAVAEVGGKIYVVGGFGGERELEIYDSAADRWSRDASIPRALHHAAGGSWDGHCGNVDGESPGPHTHDLAQRLSYSSWRRHHAWGNSSPSSFLPHGARSRNW
jgi:hypothetical protein